MYPQIFTSNFYTIFLVLVINVASTTQMVLPGSGGINITYNRSNTCKRNSSPEAACIRHATLQRCALTCLLSFWKELFFSSNEKYF